MPFEQSGYTKAYFEESGSYKELPSEVDEKYNSFKMQQRNVSLTNMTSIWIDLFQAEILIQKVVFFSQLIWNEMRCKRFWDIVNWNSTIQCKPDIHVLLIKSILLIFLAQVVCLTLKQLLCICHRTSRVCFRRIWYSSLTDYT